MYQTSTIVDVAFLIELTDISSASFSVFSENTDKMAAFDLSDELTALKDYLTEWITDFYEFTIPKKKKMV